MKKLTALICILALILSLILCGCGNKTENPETSNDNSVSEEIQNNDVEKETKDEPKEDVVGEEDEDEEEDNDSPKSPLDIKAIEELEAEDDFGVKIADKSVIEKYSVTVSAAGSDALVFDVENNTDSTVTDFEIYLVGYDKNNNKVQVGIGIGSVNLGGQSHYVTTLSPAENSEIPAGESRKLMTYCKAHTFTGVKAIVASYTDADGEVHENPIAEDWYMLASEAITLD